MKTLSAFLLALMLCTMVNTAQAARDVKKELQSIQKQRQWVKHAQQALNKQLGSVGQSLKALDVALLKARKAYRQVRKDIKAVDQRLAQLKKQKRTILQTIEKLQYQMIKEASTAYQHAGSQSVWVDMLSGTSITEIPHRQFLLKSAMLSQENDRKVWHKTMEELAVVEKEEAANKEQLLSLQKERKQAEKKLVNRLHAKKKAAKQLRADIKKKKAQARRLAQQEKALQRLVNGLGDTLLASDKKGKTLSIRKQKGKLSWPLQGRVLIAFKHKTSTGVRLSGVHIAPKHRSQKGRLVHALGEGQVRYADWFGGYGLMMIVDYGHGIMAVYAHNDALHKQLGDWVEKGEALAEAGSTGWIEDVRLYFEIRDKGRPVNPAKWCKK
ncbi:MAG: peptidoglycan DD-metalloendopeptidase family protein [Ghiorsea sp.]|nr:peptidoglycan DD-metalloendopeptidase family protein [Ghiorsea sp.]